MKWSDILPEHVLQMGDTLANRAESERKNRFQIYPAQDDIFKALTLTPPDKVKVIIIGQDPYHTPGQANGLAFSVTNGQPIQPSLQNIFKELKSDLDIPEPTTTDLTPWAEQGVLLLNTILTVYTHQANSCQDWGWQTFTAHVIKQALELPNPIVVMAWGRNAQDIVASFVTNSMNNNKLALMSSHPSPFSAAKTTKRAPAFLGSRPFSKANEFLTAQGQSPIDWKLP